MSDEVTRVRAGEVEFGPYMGTVRFEGWDNDPEVTARWWAAGGACIYLNMHPSRPIQIVVADGVGFLTPPDARALAHDLPLILTELADRAEGKT